VTPRSCKQDLPTLNAFENSGRKTRILALDFGTRRVGAAVCDPERSMAFPLEVYDRRGPDLDARHYRDLAAANDVERIVVGLPIHTTGREGRLATAARSFGDWLAEVTRLPVVYFDERYTSIEAEQRLIDARLTRQKRKALRDKLAAQIMLQSYLDAGCPQAPAPPGALFETETDENDS
jgi:putative holliday junction resolvase